MKITLPSDVELDGTSACPSFTNLNAAAVCTRTGNVMDITSAFSTGYTHGSSSSVEISNVLNPLSVKTTGSFVIAILTSTDFGIQSTSSSGGATLTFTASSGALSPITVTPGSTVASASPVTYSYCFKTAGKVSAASVLTVVLPS